MTITHPFPHSERRPSINNHQPDVRYIRSLLTRARVVNDADRKTIADMCGISLVTLNRYISYSKSALKCPYSVQYTLEGLAGLASTGTLYEVKCKRRATHLEVLAEYDIYFRGFSDSAIQGGEDVSAVIAMTDDEQDLVSNYFSSIADSVEVTRLEFDDWV